MGSPRGIHRRAMVHLLAMAPLRAMASPRATHLRAMASLPKVILKGQASHHPRERTRLLLEAIRRKIHTSKCRLGTDTRPSSRLPSLELSHFVRSQTVLVTQLYQPELLCYKRISLTS